MARTTSIEKIHWQDVFFVVYSSSHRNTTRRHRQDREIMLTRAEFEQERVWWRAYQEAQDEGRRVWWISLRGRSF